VNPDVREGQAIPAYYKILWHHSEVLLELVSFYSFKINLELSYINESGFIGYNTCTSSNGSFFCNPPSSLLPRQSLL
jgi:hypothetical protein